MGEEANSKSKRAETKVAGEEEASESEDEDDEEDSSEVCSADP